MTEQEAEQQAMGDWIPCNSFFDDVVEWHRKFGIPVNPIPYLPKLDRRILRRRLNREEMDELNRADFGDDLVEMADAIVDLIWVLCGQAAEYGIPLNECWQEVKRSNFAKLDPETGEPLLRADGKILKPPGWIPPDLQTIIDVASRMCL